jgi:hypothetical protein
MAQLQSLRLAHRLFNAKGDRSMHELINNVIRSIKREIKIMRVIVGGGDDRKLNGKTGIWLCMSFRYESLF